MHRKVELEEPYRSLAIYLEILHVKEVEGLKYFENNGGLEKYLDNVGFPERRRNYVKDSLKKLNKEGLVEYVDKDVKLLIEEVNEEGDISKLVSPGYKVENYAKAGEYNLRELYKDINNLKRVLASYLEGLGRYDVKSLKITIDVEKLSEEEEEKPISTKYTTKSPLEALKEYFEALHRNK